MVQLPQELVDSVIDYLNSDSDKAALCVCSLLSRSWLNRSQFHLFARFKPNLKNSNKVAILRRFLNDGSGIHKHIRCLQLDYRAFTIRDLSLVEALLDALTFLEDLRLSWSDPHILTHPECRVAKRYNLKLVSMTAYSGDFWSNSVVMMVLLDMLDSIRELYLDLSAIESSPKSGSSELFEDVEPRLRVQSLILRPSFHDMPDNAVFHTYSILHPILSCDEIRHVSVQRPHGKLIIGCGPLLSDVESCVESLSVDLMSIGEEALSFGQ